MKKLVIFDLDGTLLYTVPDIAAATNHALAYYGYPTHPENVIATFIGNGINKLFERALPEGEKNEENILKIRKEFIPYYNEHGRDFTRPFPGIEELLEYIRKEGIMVAVASNKYQQATTALITHYFPTIEFIAILGQREGIPTKPDKGIVEEICTIAEAKKDEVLYVGDSGVDMQTAINAQVDAIGVTWGCRPRSELSRYAPKWIVDDASEIIEILKENS